MHGSTGSGKKHSPQALNIQVFRLCQKRGAVALVNFPMRVASNLKNGRYGQKNGGRTRSGTDYQGYSGLALWRHRYCLSEPRLLPRMGKIKSDLKELHQDNREIHGDRRELHGDFKEL